MSSSNNLHDGGDGVEPIHVDEPAPMMPSEEVESPASSPPPGSPRPPPPPPAPPSSRLRRQGRTNPFMCGVVEGFYGRPWTTEQRKDLFTKMQVIDSFSFWYI